MATLVIVARVIDDCLEHARPKPWTIQRSLRNRTSHRNYDVEISLEYYVVNIREVLTHHLFKTGGDQPSPTSFVEGVVRYLDGKLLFRTYLRIITHGAITGATSLL